MAPLIYPEPTWSNGFGRVVRTLQVVAVAGAIGAVGGGVAVMALVGGGGSASRPPTAFKVSTADTAKTGTKAGTTDDAAAHPINDARAPQLNAAAAAVKIAPPAAAAAAESGTQQSPIAAEPSSNEAASEQRPVQQAAVPADSTAGTNVYNRVEPEQKAAPAHAPPARAKLPRRIKNAERDRGKRGVPYPDDRGGPYSGERYSYRNYDPPPVFRAPPAAPRGYYFGGGSGGVFYDRGGWGN